MVANVELVVSEGGCGMSLPVSPDMSPECFARVSRAILEHAVATLTRLGRPLFFEIYFDRPKGLAGWRV